MLTAETQREKKENVTTEDTEKNHKGHRERKSELTRDCNPLLIPGGEYYIIHSQMGSRAREEQEFGYKMVKVNPIEADAASGTGCNDVY